MSPATAAPSVNPLESRPFVPESPGEAAPARAESRAHGFRPTLRHQAILVAYFALLFAILVPVLERSGSWSGFNAAVVALLISPWLLASLVLIFDRHGPLKYWLATVLFAAYAPMLAFCYDLSVLANVLANGTPPRMAPLFVVNVLLITCFASYLRHAGPTHCPSCTRRALIPVYTLWGKSPRTRKTRWCACCGAGYWRDTRGDAWKVERREF